jgi:TPR repeat protein
MTGKNPTEPDQGNAMKNACFVFLLLTVAGLAHADYDDGQKAYQAHDFAKALQEWQPLADAGNARAQLGMGVLYANGQGVEKNTQQAVSWFRRAAEAGNAEAQLHLGAAYYLGNGVARDYRQAVAWYGKAAQQGNADAQFLYGQFYATGQGLQQSDSQALVWFLKAAAQGHVQAQYNAGVIYASSLMQDYEQATFWMGKAAEQGNAMAQMQMGAFYAGGKGVPKDLVKAYQWVTLSALQGDSNAPYVKQQLESDLGFFELRRARKAVNDWLVAHGQQPVKF